MKTNKHTSFCIHLLFVALFSTLTLFGCAKTVYVPVERERDTIAESRDTLIHTPIPFESNHVETDDVTATAETSFAIATAEVSDNGTLTLDLQNKDTFVPVMSRVHYRITTITEPTPYPIEVVQKVRYVAWYDYVIRILGIPSFIIVVIYVIRKWKIGLRSLVSF